MWIWDLFHYKFFSCNHVFLGNDAILGIVGNLKEIGSWNLGNALLLKAK